MTDMIRPTVSPGLPVSQAAPAAPDAGAKSEAPPAPGAAEAPLAPAALGVLDKIMQAFLVDGRLDATETQAYQAARASFTGGWAGVPLPAGHGPDAAQLEDDALASEPHTSALLANGAGAAVARGGAVQERPMASKTPATLPTGAAEQSAGLKGALADYRKAILAHDQQAQGYNAMVFSGLTGVGDRPVHLLPGLMIPEGVRILTWAALDREPTDAEMADYKATMAGPDTSAGMMKVMDTIMAKAPDRPAAALRLYWHEKDKAWEDTPESLAQQSAFSEVMRQGMQGAAPAAAPHAAPAAPPPVAAPAAAPKAPLPAVGDPTVKPADYSGLKAKLATLPGGFSAPGAWPLRSAITLRDDFAKLAETGGDPNARNLFWGDDPPTRKKGIAIVGNQSFDWGARNPGLLGGWDSPPLGKTYVTADALIPWGGYNDIHYWPDCKDPAYQAMWELRFAANNGDAAAWTELAKFQLVGLGQALTRFTENRPMQVSPAFPAFKDKEGAASRAEQEHIADMMIAARDRWKAGGTQVVTADDPDFSKKQGIMYADAVRELDGQIATLTPLVVPGGAT